MARPRVFVSSTYYDLKHVRYSLDTFIERLGYDSILSEKGDIAYSFDIPLDESCYREVDNVDIFVLIIGGRYGSERSNAERKVDKKFFDRYESITKSEYEVASKKDIPIFILIEANVYAEFQTYLKNKGNEKINYAHVDSLNIFVFVEDILSRPRNNPIKTFDRFDDIESWLREQWAGLFRELLTRKSQQNQIRTLTTEISGLQEVNNTLKTYLEAVLKGLKPGESESLIESEQQRLTNFSIRKKLEDNPLVRYLTRNAGIDIDLFIQIMDKTNNIEELENFKLSKKGDNKLLNFNKLIRIVHQSEPRRDLNNARALLNLKPFPDPVDESVEIDLEP